MSKCSCCGEYIDSKAIKCRYCFEEQIPELSDNNIILSSLPTIDGYEIIEYCGFIYGETVCPDGLFGAITNGTFLSSSALADARETALSDLIKEAQQRKANAVIGVDIDISDLRGGILVSANGTAVYAIPLDYKNKMRIRSQEILEHKQQQDAAEEERSRQLADTLSKLNNYEVGYTALDKNIVKIISKNESINVMNIMKLFPKSVSTTDVSCSLNKLVEGGIIEKLSNGNYKYIM